MKMENVADFISACRSEDGRELNSLFFRGENEKHDKLIPSIYRPKFRYIENEDKIFKETVARFPDEILAQKTTVEKLILMQHFELPTRLLDVSKNPLVALFFACYGNENKDGRVYIFSVPESEIKYCDSDTVSVISNLCKRPASFSIKGTGRMSKNRFNEEKEISYLVHEIREEKPHFMNLVVRKHLNSVVCVRPRMNNPRILRQDGYFFLFGIKDEKGKCAEVQKTWIANRVIIPKESKRTILAELDFLNINESFLFPDYQHLAATFQKKYEQNSGRIPGT